MNERWKCGDDVPDPEGIQDGAQMSGKWGIPDDAQMQYLASQEDVADDFVDSAECTLPFTVDKSSLHPEPFVPQAYPEEGSTVGDTTIYPEEWSEEQEEYCPITDKESTYVPQVLPENFCPITEPECPKELPYAPEEEDSSNPTVGFMRIPSTEVENVIIVESEAKKYGFAQALGVSLKSDIPYFIANTSGPIRRLWLDPNKIPDAISGVSPESVWVKEYSIDIEGSSPLNPQKVPFFPLYQITPRKRGKSTKRSLANLLNSVKQASQFVYIATDDTPEGELQAWHIWTLVAQYEQQEKKPGAWTSKLRRLRYSEVSEKAIKEALENATGLNDALRAQGVAKEVLKRLITYSTGLVLQNLTGLGRSLPQSTLDASTTAPTLNAIESGFLAVLSKATRDHFQEMPPLLGKVEVDLQLGTNKNLVLRALKEGDVEKYRTLEGEQITLRTEKASKKTKVLPPLLPNGIDVGIAAAKELGIPFSSYFFSLLSELFGYGAISTPNTLSRSLSKEGFGFIKKLLKEDGISLPKNQKIKGKDITGLSGIVPVVDNLADLIATLPESARQLLFQKPQRYRALLDTFNLIKRSGEASVLSPAAFSDIKVSLKKNKLELEGEGKLVTTEGFLKAWKTDPTYQQRLENMGVEESLEGLEETSRAQVKNVLARNWIDVGRPWGILELMSFLEEQQVVDLGSPKDVYMAVESEALGARRIGLKNNQYFYDPDFLAHARLPGGNVSGVTPLGLFMSSLMGDLFPKQGAAPGLSDLDFSQIAEKDLREIGALKDARSRQARILKLLNNYWGYLRPRLSYARKVTKEISQSYRRRGARVHWLDIRRPPIAFPGASADIPLAVADALAHIGDGEFQVADNGFLMRTNKERRQVDMVWASPRKLYYRTYHFYELDDVSAGVKYPAVWTMTYWTSFDIPDILDTYASAQRVAVPESMSLPEVWGLFLNLNWDSFDVIPSACFPAHRRIQGEGSIYNLFKK